MCVLRSVGCVFISAVEFFAPSSRSYLSRALVLELPAHGLEFAREVWMDVNYKGEMIGEKRVEFII